jgi:hypothetical protein
MNYILIELGFKGRKVIQVDDSYNVEKVISDYLRRGYNAYQVCKPPSLLSLIKLNRGVCGCVITNQRGARCSVHNRMSWRTFYHL